MSADNKADKRPQPQSKSPRNRISGIEPASSTVSSERSPDSVAEQLSDALTIVRARELLSTPQGRAKLLAGYREQKRVNRLKQSN